MAHQSTCHTDTQHAPPLGLHIEVENGYAAVANSKLEREFHVPDDEIGSKSEVAAAAFECLLLALVDAGVPLESPHGVRAIERAVASIRRRL